MKILLVLGTLSGRGGIETCVATVARAAALHGDELKVVALAPSQVDSQWHQGLNYTDYHCSPVLKKQAFQGMGAVLKEMRAFQPDAVVCIYTSTLVPVALARWLVCRKAVVSLWMHFGLSLRQRTGLAGLADKIMCISKPIEEGFKAAGVAPSRLVTVPNGIDLSRVTQLVEPPSLADGGVVFAHVGRLMMGGQKQTDVMLRQLALVKGAWRLKIVGSGVDEEVAALHALARELGIADRIEWMGWQADPWAAVGRVSALVLCSAYEGLPMILIEAIARGVPCISSNCDSGPSDILIPGVNGMLYEVSRPQELAPILQQMVDGGLEAFTPQAVAQTAQRFDFKNTYRVFRQALLAR
jgi:UDP-D-galactose:(glucosyl)LPS alpha-1,6-D-galactosyltransferase